VAVPRGVIGDLTRRMPSRHYAWILNVFTP